MIIEVFYASMCVNFQHGSAIVKVNPVDMIGKVPAVSVPTELFKPAGTGLVNSSCILQLNTTVLPHFTSENGECHSCLSSYTEHQTYFLHFYVEFPFRFSLRYSQSQL